MLTKVKISWLVVILIIVFSYQLEDRTYHHQATKPNLSKRVLEIDLWLNWARPSKRYGLSRMSVNTHGLQIYALNTLMDN